jgi:hypothetical protein
MVKGKAVAIFGTGDIAVTHLVSADYTKGFIVLQNQETQKIGTHSNNFENKPATDTVLCFSNIESLEVVIDSLTKLKDMMQGNAYECLSSDFIY